MRISSFTLLLAMLAASLSCLAQRPDYNVTIIADGKPLKFDQGLPISTKTIELTGQLTPESQQRYPQMKPTVSINKAVLNLIRDTELVAQVNWPKNESIASLFKRARAGDRFLIQFDDTTVQLKEGTTQRIDNSKILQITVRE